MQLPVTFFPLWNKKKEKQTNLKPNKKVHKPKTKTNVALWYLLFVLIELKRVMFV